MAAPATRAVRSDGIRSREAILRTAASFASVHGLQELSLGELADAVGMSKSGLYAHFGSKEELQLATVETARETFTEVVLDRAEAYPAGVDGLVALSDAFCEHIRERVFPGGCFFDSTAVDVMSHPGPVRDAVMGVQMDWRARGPGRPRGARGPRGVRPPEGLHPLGVVLLAPPNPPPSTF